MVSEDGSLALPWLAAPLAEALATQRGHAILVHSAAGCGSFEFALALAQGWLCESSDKRRPCGRCGGCRQLGARSHPDLFVLLPEAERRSRQWLLADDKADDEGRRKPSRQIRIDDVRSLIDWAAKTGARGQGKVALLHPAETMNPAAASALLKTLEEPPAGTRLVLTAADPAHLLPTVRSRCQRLVLPLPDRALALRWLAEQGVADAATLLDGCAGAPLDALALHREGVDARAWAALPAAVASGQAGALSGWPAPRAIDTLQKVCHDAMVTAAGSAPKYFTAGVPVARGALPALVRFHERLARAARHADHPWHETLLLEALVSEARAAWAGRTLTE